MNCVCEGDQFKSRARADVVVEQVMRKTSQCQITKASHFNLQGNCNQLSPQTNHLNNPLADVSVISKNQECSKTAQP